MKRFAPLALIVLALAAVPVAFADNGTPSAPPSVTPPATAPAAPGQQSGQQGHPFARIQLELLRIRLQMVQLRYRIACHDASSDRCAKFTQAVSDRLTKLDQNVQDRLAKNCSSTASTDKRCDVLTKLDQKLQDVISKLGTAPSSSSESGLDNAAGNLAGSTKP